MDHVEQVQLFESNVVSLAEFRERRPPVSADLAARDVFPAKPRPVSRRSIAHQARMLAHLTGTLNSEPGTGNRKRGTASY